MSNKIIPQELYDIVNLVERNNESIVNLRTVQHTQMKQIDFIISVLTKLAKKVINEPPDEKTMDNALE